MITLYRLKTVEYDQRLYIAVATDSRPINFKASNGIVIKSGGAPGYDKEERTLYIYNADKERFNWVILVMTEEARDVEEAVQEYNRRVKEGSSTTQVPVAIDEAIR